MTVHIPLAGSKRALLPHSRPAGKIDPNEQASLTIRVRSKGDTKALVARAYELADTPLQSRTYATHEQLTRDHGADPADLDAVEHYAQAHNLLVVHRSAAERSIVLKGRLGDLLAAFPANLMIYHHATGTYRGRQGEILVPTELASVITGIFGFDTRPRQRSPHLLKRFALSGPGGDNGVSATFFATRYQFPTEYAGGALDGTGQTIAIIELGGGYQVSDLQTFFKEIGVSTPTVSSVSVDHAGNNPTTYDSDDGEVMLDIEVAGAVTPAANIVVYFAPNNGDQGFIDAISAAVHDTERNPGVISISWGGPEVLTDQQGINAFHELFAAAGNLGITVCVATGDHGTADLAAGQWDQKIHVDHPACDDLVLACGGTQIDGGALTNPALGEDVVWNDNTPFNVTEGDGGGWASGGGISEVFPVPSYQANANLPVSLDDGQPGRGIPDVAMSATNYFTRVDTQEGASGGTSAVAPLMAALIARLNQAAQKRVGFINPFLYAHAADGIVVDVTSGTNAIANTVQGYDAGPGWDACSGLGTPVGVAILNQLGGVPSTGTT
jgi:kumamolisin